MEKLPVIDLTRFGSAEDADAAVAAAIREACTAHGFFYISGHGIDTALQERLEEASRQFFERPEAEKMIIGMERGGRAWRGYFPVGGELTSGRPDWKEGLYFGSELMPDDPRVAAGWPMHGANLFPEGMEDFRKIVLEYMQEVTRLGHRLMEALSLSLGLPAGYFHSELTADPLILFRIFHYPPGPASREERYGVGEHTDYGILTILKQDAVGGLQVKRGDAWIDAPPLENTFICNIGDMLDRMTGGYYRSTPHRVLNTSGRDRYSFPLFFDPGFDTVVRPVRPRVGQGSEPGMPDRWDGQDIHAFEGTYGTYLLEKVSKVFPQLRSQL